MPLDRRATPLSEAKLPAELQMPRAPGEKPDRLSSVGGFTTLLTDVAGRGFDDHPDGVGTPALPGQYLNFNMHYTPTGRPETDRSEVGLWFAREPLKKFHFRTPINERQHVNGKLVRGPVQDAADIEAGRVSQGATPTTISSFSGLPPIPPYMANYMVTSELAITQGITINGFYPHMHVRGKVAEYKVLYPDDREQLLFEVLRHVTDSRGYSDVQMAEVGGNIGGDYRLFFKSAPLTFRIDIEVAADAGPFVHMSPWRFRRQ